MVRKKKEVGDLNLVGGVVVLWNILFIIYLNKRSRISRGGRGEGGGEIWLNVYREIFTNINQLLFIYLFIYYYFFIPKPA